MFHNSVLCSESQPSCSLNLEPLEDKIKDTSKWLRSPLNIEITVLSCQNPRFQDGYLSNRYFSHLQIVGIYLGSSRTSPGRNHLYVLPCSFGTLPRFQNKHCLSFVSLAETIWHSSRVCFTFTSSWFEFGFLSLHAPPPFLWWSSRGAWVPVPWLSSFWLTKNSWCALRFSILFACWPLIMAWLYWFCSELRLQNKIYAYIAEEAGFSPSFTDLGTVTFRLSRPMNTDGSLLSTPRGPLRWNSHFTEFRKLQDLNRKYQGRFCEDSDKQMADICSKCTFSAAFEFTTLNTFRYAVVITGDKTWVFEFNTERIQQSSKWRFEDELKAKKTECDGRA